jgi:hypothetical protein
MYSIPTRKQGYVTSHPIKTQNDNVTNEATGVVGLPRSLRFVNKYVREWTGVSALSNANPQSHWIADRGEINPHWAHAFIRPRLLWFAASPFSSSAATP